MWMIVNRLDSCTLWLVLRHGQWIHVVASGLFEPIILTMSPQILLRQHHLFNYFLLKLFPDLTIQQTDLSSLMRISHSFP